MSCMKLLTLKYRIGTILLILAIAIMFVLFAQSPSSAQGQVNVNSPATMSECNEELAAGRAVLCTRNSFSVKTTLADGGYHINWSKWADRYSNVDRYTIQRLRFLYRYNFEREDDSSAVSASDYTIPDVNSCRPNAAETNNMGEATRWAWSCTGISNVREDPLGASTSIELLESNWTGTSWSDSLLAPGRKHDVPVQAFKIPGSQTEAHADNPQNATDRLTQQQINDGTDNLLASDVEMHLYLIVAHFQDGRRQYRYDLVDGSPFDDRQ